MTVCAEYVLTLRGRGAKGWPSLTTFSFLMRRLPLEACGNNSGGFILLVLEEDEEDDVMFSYLVKLHRYK